jgi:hypothetical protein
MYAASQRRTTAQPRAGRKKKQGVSKKPLRQGESLHARVHRDLERIRRAPALVRSFFRAPSVAYATY